MTPWRIVEPFKIRLDFRKYGICRIDSQDSIMPEEVTSWRSTKGNEVRVSASAPSESGAGVFFHSYHYTNIAFYTVPYTAGKYSTLGV